MIACVTYSILWFQFACGEYIAKTVIPDDKNRLYSFTETAEIIMDQAKIILEEDPSNDDFESYKLAQDYYKSCVNQDRLEELGVQPLQDKLRELGGWPVLVNKFQMISF